MKFSQVNTNQMLSTQKGKHPLLKGLFMSSEIFIFPLKYKVKTKKLDIWSKNEIKGFKSW